MVGIAITTGAIGFALGVLSAGVWYGRKHLALDAREAEIALAEMRQATRPLIAINAPRSIVKPREDDPHAPTADESPAELVITHKTKAGEILASARSIAAEWRRSLRDGMTSELMSAAYPPRRERTHTNDVPAGAIIERLRQDRAALTAKALERTHT